MKIVKIALIIANITLLLVIVSVFTYSDYTKTQEDVYSIDSFSTNSELSFVYNVNDKLPFYSLEFDKESCSESQINYAFTFRNYLNDYKVWAEKTMIFENVETQIESVSNNNGRDFVSFNDIKLGGFDSTLTGYNKSILLVSEECEIFVVDSNRYYE